MRYVTECAIKLTVLLNGLTNKCRLELVLSLSKRSKMNRRRRNERQRKRKKGEKLSNRLPRSGTEML